MQQPSQLFDTLPPLGSWANPRQVTPAPRPVPRIVCRVPRRRHDPEQLTLDAEQAAAWAAAGQVEQVDTPAPRKRQSGQRRTPLRTLTQARDVLARERHADAIAEAIERSAEDPDDTDAHVHLRALLAESLRQGWHR